MSITTSGLHLVTLANALTNAIALDLTSSSHKLALFQSTITPNFSASAAYGSGAYASGGEVTGTGWPAGGKTLSTAAAGGTSTAPTLTVVGGNLVWDMANVVVSGVTISGARGALAYADALSDQAIALIDLETDLFVTAGVLEIQFDAAGMAVIGP
jgi:hypothetical protein